MQGASNLQPSTLGVSILAAVFCTQRCRREQSAAMVRVSRVPPLRRNPSSTLRELFPAPLSSLRAPLLFEDLIRIVVGGIFLLLDAQSFLDFFRADHKRLRKRIRPIAIQILEAWNLRFGIYSAQIISSFADISPCIFHTTSYAANSNQFFDPG